MRERLRAALERVATLEEQLAGAQQQVRGLPTLRLHTVAPGSHGSCMPSSHSTAP